MTKKHVIYKTIENEIYVKKMFIMKIIVGGNIDGSAFRQSFCKLLVSIVCI